MNNKNREQYITRVERAFRAYIEAVSNYRDEECDGDLVVLRGDLLDSLEEEFGPLSIQSTCNEYSIGQPVSLEELSCLEKISITPVPRKSADDEK